MIIIRNKLSRWLEQLEMGKSAPYAAWKSNRMNGGRITNLEGLETHFRPGATSLPSHPGPSDLEVDTSNVDQHEPSRRKVGSSIAGPCPRWGIKLVGHPRETRTQVARHRLSIGHVMGRVTKQHPEPA